MSAEAISYDSYERLAQAIDSGDIVTVVTLINTQSELRKRENVLADALAMCCEKGCHEVVHRLLAQEGADPNLQSTVKHMYPPLILAIRYFQKKLANNSPPATQQGNRLDLNHSERTKSIVSLLQHGASLTACDLDGRNVLFHVTSGSTAELLLGARSGPELQEALTLKDHFGYDALMSAIIRKCDVTVSMNLIAHGANIHTVDNDQRTTLMNAVEKRRVDVVGILLKDKSITRKRDVRGRNIWHHVARDEGHDWEEELINLLLTIDENDASVNHTDAEERTPLHICSIFGNFTIAKTLLDNKKAIVDAAESVEHKTALHFAAAYGNADMIKLLIDHDAERIAFCNGNLIPLHLACGCDIDNVEAVRILLDKDAELQLSTRTEDNMTPLHIAAAQGNIGIVKTLLEPPLFPNVNAQSQGGWTALHLACGRRGANSDPTKADAQEQNYTDIVQILLKEGSQVNQRSQTSRTALHLAAEFGHVEIVKLLLAQRDVQFAAKDSNGNTPFLGAAKSEQRDAILRLLAPWSELSIDALPGDIKRSAQVFDANVIDFDKAPGAKPRRHKLPVFDLLYTPFSEPGAISKRHVSTKPSKGGFRWIHLPANNLHWCHTLLTKHFIEGGFADVDGFKHMEKSLGQLQYRGSKTYSQVMRPTYLAPSLPPGAPGRVLTNPGSGAVHGALRPPVRSSSVEVTRLERDPRLYNSPRNEGMHDFHHFDPDPRKAHCYQLPRSKPARLPSRVSIGEMGEGSARGDHLASDVIMKPPTDSSSTTNDSSGTHWSLPYLALESEEFVHAMHARLPSRSINKTRKPVGPPDVREIHLLKAYANWEANDYGLHIRRTLDQFFYRNVDTRLRDDDQVVLRYQRQRNKDARAWKDLDEKDDDPDENLDVLMVDQLWVWVLGPELIVTSFPQKWRQPRMELPDLLGSVLEKLDPRTGDPVQSIHGLATCIVGQCMSTCGRNMYQSYKASILDVFSCSVGNAMDKELELFSRFERASAVASLWAKYALLNNTKAMHELETRYDQSRDAGSRSGLSKEMKTESWFGMTKEPSFVEDLLDIQDESKLLREVKGIRDELGILLQVTEDQGCVHKDILDNFGPATESEPISSDQHQTDNFWKEQHASWVRQHTEIEEMMRQVDSVYKSIIDLLDHKQAHHNALEARYGSGYAHSQAAETAKVGRTLMIFTVVTIIFLPMSFLAAFFAINIKELPHVDGEQQMSLSFVMQNVVGVGLGTALAFVLIAWHHHRAVDWLWRLTKYIFTLPKSIKKPIPTDHGVHG